MAMKTLMCALFTLLYFDNYSQTSTPITVEKDPIRSITVTGVAEMEVTPDELYFTISLKEYFKDDKNKKDKVLLTTLEKQLIDAVKAAGLAKENLTISGVTGYREWNPKRQPQHFLAGKQFELKLSNANNINDLLSKVDDRGIEYVSMSRVEHSKKEEFRRQVKTNALKAAKEKAGYLVESIEEKLGEVIEIHEVEDGSIYPVMYKQAQYNVRMASMEAADAGGGSELEYQKIKYSYRMNAVFRIK